MAFAELHPRIEQVLGKRMPPEHSVRGLDQLPADVARDAEVLQAQVGSLLAFAYLLHVTDAGFGEIKLYCSSRGWATGVD